MRNLGASGQFDQFSDREEQEVKDQAEKWLLPL